MRRKIDISHKTIFFITAFLLGLWLLFLIRDLLLILFVSLILMSALSPAVIFFERFRIPKALGIGITYLVILTIIVGGLVVIVPPLVEQTGKLIVTLPPLASQIFTIFNIDRSVFQSSLTSLSKNAFSFTLAVFDNFLAIIFLLVITFYLLLEKDKLEDRFSLLFYGREDRVKALFVLIEDKLGSWLRGQLFLSIIIGLLSFIGLIALDIPYALPLAIIAGIMEVVPVIGPIVSAIPAIAIALTISPFSGLFVALMFLVIQQFENHLIVPQVMKRAVGLNPLVVILAIAVGGRLLGVGGALLAVPIAVVLQIIATEFIIQKTSIKSQEN